MSLQKTLNTLEEIVPSNYNRVVAAEPGEKGTALLYFREENDSEVKGKLIRFYPFLLLSSPDLLADSDIKCNIAPLKGDAKFAYIARFPDTAEYKLALKELKKSTGANPSSPYAPYKTISDMSQMLFISSQFRLFRGMTFNEVRRFQFDIETLTTEGYEFPNPQRKGDKISMISMSDNSGWSECIVLDDPYSEKELLEKFIEIINEHDPDVLEGHNIFKFDLPFIEERAKQHAVPLAIGRTIPKTEGRRIMKKRASRVSIAERTINYPKYEVFGRHIVDTFHLVQHYDVIHRELEGYGLKTVAKHFGVSAENRTYIDGEKISEMFTEDPETLKKYALDDVLETRAIARILAPSFFYQTQLVPISLQNCVVRGNASRIESMLIAAYLSEEESIPAPEASQPFSGALTDAPESGVFNNIWHCDIRSLYPSIILAEDLIPARDSLEIFPFYLDKLRTFRLIAKDAERALADKIKSGEGDKSASLIKDEYNALQTTFKILINSFYGYLGFAQGSFNDYAMADKVTERGREILTMMLDFLRSRGAKIIEMDTDGIYFQPAPEMTTSEIVEEDPEVLKKMEEEIQAILPSGIEVELDSVYPAMFSYKSKNYALLNSNGEVAITGAALKSRGLEPFQRDFLKRLMEYLLKGERAQIDLMLDEYRNAILNRKWPLAKFAKTETLQDSPEKYSKKMKSGKGRRSAAYELALSSNRTYRQGDMISYYVTGDKKRVSIVDNSRLLKDAPEERDENILYYANKIELLAAKFKDFIQETANTYDRENPLGLEF
jgi:DNA polymerase elongation subunit (family B)